MGMKGRGWAIAAVAAMVASGGSTASSAEAGMPTAAAAADVRTLTLSDCVALGLRQSGVALNARRDETIAGHIRRQASSIALPHVSMQANYTRLDELQSIDFGDGAEDFGTLDNYEVRADVEQLLYASGKVGAALRAANLTQEHAAWRRRDVESALVLDLRLGFYRLLLARDVLAVREASVDQLGALSGQTDRKVAHGAASEFDQLTARVRVANERSVLIQARNERQLAVAEYCRLLDVDEEAVRFAGELVREAPPGDLATLTGVALANRPALRAAALRLSLGYEDFVATRADGRPRLDAFLTYDGANAYRFVSFDNAWEWHWSAGVRLSWNIWDGGLTRHAAREKALTHAKLGTDLDELTKQVALEIRQAWLAMEHAAEALAAGDDTIAAAARALEIAQSRHGSGLGTYLDVTDANLALSTARLVRQQALHDHAVSVARLRHACGLKDWGAPAPADDAAPGEQR